MSLTTKASIAGVIAIALGLLGFRDLMIVAGTVFALLATRWYWAVFRVICGYPTGEDL